VGHELRPRRALPRQSLLALPPTRRDHVRTGGLKVIGGVLCVLVLVHVPSNRARAVSTAKALAVSYSMPKRFGLDQNRDRLIDYQDTVAEVRPVGWPVDFMIAACDRAASFRWTVNGKPAAFASTGRCAWRHTFRREGSYAVRVRAAGPKHARAGGVDVVVQDWLLVGLGDSVASGEGVPDIAGRGGTWQDRGCHRSATSFEALAARRLEDGDARTSVTFVHVACSGATINDVLGRQLDAVRGLIGGREIDAVLASVGANDLRFGPVVLFCVTQPDCPSSTWGGVPGGPTLGQLMPAWVSELNGRYVALAGALSAVTPPSRTYLTEYFDPLHAGAVLCTQSADVGGQRLEVTAAEAQWLLDNFLVPLNREVSRAAAAQGWSFVAGAQARFALHGYCAGEPWVVRYEESLLAQGDANGTLHPNRSGHAALAELLLHCAATSTRAAVRALRASESGGALGAAARDLGCEPVGGGDALADDIPACGGGRVAADADHRRPACSIATSSRRKRDSFRAAVRSHAASLVTRPPRPSRAFGRPTLLGWLPRKEEANGGETTGALCAARRGAAGQCRSDGRPGVRGGRLALDHQRVPDEDPGLRARRHDDGEVPQERAAAVVEHDRPEG
jgi:hypothetical protein